MDPQEKELLRSTQEQTCPSCNAPYVPGDEFCTSCGQRIPPVTAVPKPADQLQVADGGARFWAFIIDLIVIGIISGSLSGLFWFATDSDIYFGGFETAFFPYYAVGFIYYVLTELIWGQTLGKMALGTIVVSQDTGKPPTGEEFVSVVINNFGKAFLFPLDVILGWILAGRWKEESGIDLKQRFFQRLARQVVVKKVFEPTPSGVRFIESQ
ncbi:MAG: RDD family protein [Candidatus Hodarchaeota archaeon]